MEETLTSRAFTLIAAPCIRGTKQAYLLRMTISIQNRDIFANDTKLVPLVRQV
jgi:hypothetical protein